MSIANTANGYHNPKRRKLSHDTKQQGSVQTKQDLTSHDDDSQDSVTSSSEREVVGELRPKPSQQKVLNKGVGGLQSTSVSQDSRAPSSATFNFQIKELVRDNKPNYASRLKMAKPQIERIENLINSIPEQKSLTLAQAETYAKKTLRVTIPWGHRPSLDINYKFSFAKPSTILTTGWLAHQFSRRQRPSIVLVPEMPNELFQEKDYLNYRAIHKRAFYLACIASALHRDLLDDFEISYAYFEDNDLVPVLTMIPKAGNNSTSATVFTINPSLPKTLGPIEKMLPDMKCLRKEDTIRQSSQTQTDHDWVYNSTVRALSAASGVHALIENAANEAENFRDSCLLGAIWLEQRGFESSLIAGGFGLDEWAVICSLLLASGGPQGRPLFSSRYSAVQLFKAMLQVLSTRDMSDPFVVRGSYQIPKSDRPVMFDAITGTNVFYKMTSSSYARLKLSATISLAAVNSQKLDRFEVTFISKVSDHVLQYDEVYEIDLTNVASSHIGLQYFELLKRGLGDRVSLIDLKRSSFNLWRISAPEPVQGQAVITIGLLTNPEAAARLIDHGPLVEEKGAVKEFRRFWGEKAELRKFKDGTISESLTWSPDSSVTQQIFYFLCLKHFNIQQSAIKTSESLEKYRLRNMLSTSNREAFTTINSKFQSLSSTLHHLDGLPLPIRSVTPASSYLRSSSVALPLELGPSQPIDVVIQFDTSSRWPDHLAAIQYTKIAFLTKVSDLLISGDKTLTTRVGLEHTSTSSFGIYNTSFLDISYPSSLPTIPPITFRLRVYHDREVQLIQQRINSKSSPLQGPLRDTYQSALITQKRDFIAAPQHTTAIRNLITQFAPLSTTIRFLKRWISAHHLTNHIPEHILEIICASVFLSPLPWTIPGTPTTAFARCLYFLANWNWAREPLLVDLSPSQDMSSDQRAELTTRFAAWRKLDPNLNTVAWFIGTNVDPTGVVWTQSDLSHKGPQPARVVAARVSALAGAALQVLKYTDETEKVQRNIMTKQDWDSVFTSSVADFDFVIHLKGSNVGRHNASASGARKKKQYKNLELASSLEIDTTGIDDVESYVADLEDTFGSVALFFYGGKYSGNGIIGGLWRPHLMGEKAWKIRLGYSTIPVPISVGDEGGEGEARCTANLDGMLAEMGLMGDGIVERILRKEQQRV